jgi:chromosome segregation ATPase
MDTATKAPQALRATDRVLEALSTLAALLDKSINEVKALDADFQKRLVQAVQDTETSVQSQAALQLEETLAETKRKLDEQHTRNVGELSIQWEEERARLSAELSKMTQTKAQWEAERARLQGELDRLSRVQAQTQVEAEKAIMAMRSASAAAKNAKAGAEISSEVLTNEIQRVEGLIKDISTLIENPSTDLSTVIRKNVERAELESYLKGIRYALDGGR